MGPKRELLVCHLLLGKLKLFNIKQEARGGGDGGGRETEHFKLTAAGTILLQRGQLYNLVLYSIILWVFSESTPKLTELDHSVKLIL